MSWGQLTGVEDVDLVDDAFVAAADDHHQVLDGHGSVSMSVGVTHESLKYNLVFLHWFDCLADMELTFLSAKNNSR